MPSTIWNSADGAKSDYSGGGPSRIDRHGTSYTSTTNCRGGHPHEHHSSRVVSGVILGVSLCSVAFTFAPRHVSVTCRAPGKVSAAVGTAWPCCHAALLSPVASEVTLARKLPTIAAMVPALQHCPAACRPCALNGYNFERLRIDRGTGRRRRQSSDHGRWALIVRGHWRIRCRPCCPWYHHSLPRRVEICAHHRTSLRRVLYMTVCYVAPAEGGLRLRVWKRPPVRSLLPTRRRIKTPDWSAVDGGLGCVSPQLSGPAIVCPTYHGAYWEKPVGGNFCIHRVATRKVRLLPCRFSNVKIRAKYVVMGTCRRSRL